MKKYMYCLFFVWGVAACSDAPEKEKLSPRMIISEYPKTEKADSLLEFFGTPVNDPYLWLEDDNSEATRAWVDAQNTVTRSYLDSIPFRQKIKDRYTDIFNFEKVGIPIKTGDYFFIYKNSGLEPQGKYFIRKGLDGEEEVFLDINALSDNGTVSAELLEPSEDNRWIPVKISEAGSDWNRIVVYDIATKKPTGDELKWVKFSEAAWYNNGFFYSRYPEPAAGKVLSGNNQNHIIYYHQMGQPQSKDQLIYADPKRPNLYHNVFLTEDKKFLILVAAPGTDGYEVYFKNPADTKAHFTPLFTDIHFHNSVITSTKDGQLLVLTDIDAPRYRLVKINLQQPQKENWTEVIPQSENLLQSVTTCGGKLFATYLDKANTRVFQMNEDGTQKQEIALPDSTGTASGFHGKATDDFCFYAFSSFTYPGVIYKYDITSGKSTVYYSPQVKFNPQDYESKQVFYKSKDGTEIPMFIVHKKGLPLNGKNPTLLYGYGGFNIPLTPGFSSSRMILLENGGVFAMANLRGGGEFGEEWHKAGMLDKKQNVFDDFISAAEYLIQQGYTSNEKLAIEGGSNGGLLVGACMTQRPDLFKVALPAVGVLDMLRFHLFTVGKGWIPEYGCADSSNTQFSYLYTYSPYHRLRQGTSYPATLIMTADHDDRVVPAHSFKFAAKLQASQAGNNPVLIRIEKSAGHGAGKSTDQIIEEQTDKWAFFFYNIGKDI